VIRSFASKDAERLFQDQFVRRFQGFERAARKKLEMLDAATSLDDLRRVPGNRLEALRGDRTGQWSIRINRQWRLCFEWREGAPCEVEIAGYH
jgi:toxin HigB-1